MEKAGSHLQLNSVQLNSALKGGLSNIRNRIMEQRYSDISPDHITSGHTLVSNAQTIADMERAGVSPTRKKCMQGQQTDMERSGL